MENISLNIAEKRLLRKIFKHNQIYVDKLKSNKQINALRTLIHYKLVTDRYNHLSKSQQVTSQRGKIYLITYEGRNQLLNARREKIRFVLPIVISVCAMLISLGSLIVTIVEHFS